MLAFGLCRVPMCAILWLELRRGQDNRKGQTMLLPEDAMKQRWDVIREYLDALHAMVNRPGATCAELESQHVYFLAAWDHIDSLACSD